jgi:hypothetical protein
MNNYEQFIAARATARQFDGIDGVEIAPHLSGQFAFQADLVRWALRRGRAAIFADTGLGKTAMQIEWARHVGQRGNVLILAPLAVAEQTVREAARFGVLVRYERGGRARPITITNYELLHKFSPGDFAGIVLDESSILKAYDGATRNAIISAFAATPYRLACTATPAPNDYTELGNHSEFLGVKSRMEMLSEFFIHDGGSTQDWRVKGHAEIPFWRWVCSWGAVVKRPSDLGYDDGAFRLPPLKMYDVLVRLNHADFHAEGLLFAPTVTTLAAQRTTRRATIGQRVAEAVRIANSGTGQLLVWCELNREADLVTAALGPDAVQVQGADDPETKTDRLLGFADDRYRILVCKPSIAGHGLNWQRCHRMVFLGASHSYEGTYQAIRRCWRYGQTQPVDVYIIRAENEDAIVANYRRKEADAERLSDAMVGHMRDIMRAEISAAQREWTDYNPQVEMAIPPFVAAAAREAATE